MRINHLFAFFTVFLYCFCSHAQADSVASRVSFALRGKYFIFGLENSTLRVYSYGGEVHFGKHHAIGVDGGVFRTKWDTDDGDDADGTSDILYSDIVRRTFVYADYKYLIPVKNQVLYALVYTKQNGRYFSFNQKQDDAYANEHPELFEAYGRGKFTEYGVGAGAMMYFKKKEGKLGIDINLNLAFRDGSTRSSYYSETKGWEEGSNSDDLIYPYLRFTLFYHFFRYQK